MQKDYPATVPGPNGDYLLANNAYGPYNTWQRFTQFSVKGDHNISNNDHLSGSFARTTQPQYQGNASGIARVGQPLNTADPFSSAIVKPVNTTWCASRSDHTFTPTLLNHAGIYFNRVTNSHSTTCTPISRIP